MTDEEKEIAARCKKAMEEAGIQAKDLAREIKRTPATVSEYLNGTLRIPVITLLEISKKTGRSLDFLASGQKGKRPAPTKDLSKEEKQAVQTAEAVLKVAHLEDRFQISDVSTGDDYKRTPEPQPPDPGARELMAIYHQLSEEDRLQLIKTGKGWLAVNESRKNVGGGSDLAERTSA